jgi:GrpB-like predicted nucleotidyltransferase (UPF0157 family)
MMLHPRLLFVPLDDRPVCFDFVAEVARAAGIDVRTPDRRFLGDRRTPGDVDAIWSWLDAETAAGEAHALIASVEMLCFGGLVASRKSTAPFDEIAPYLRRLEEVARRLPAYVSAIIPRTPQQPTAEDAEHWRARDVDALRRHRDRQFRVHDALIGASVRGAFRYLLIGQDDTVPGSAGAEERARLEARPDVEAARAILLTTGADELNARLLARYLRDVTGLSPAVRTIYTYPRAVDTVPRYEATPLRRTVEEHIESTGCHAAVEAVDILLWVHNFDGAQKEAHEQLTGTIEHGAGTHVRGAEAHAPTEGPRREVRIAAADEQITALADVRFANGADAALVESLLAEPRFAEIVAYGGWNTCSNTLGSVLAQAVVAFHLRANTVAGSDRIYRPVLFTRILDDWGYQAVVRPKLARWLAGRGAGTTDLDGLEEQAGRVAVETFQAGVLPRLQSSFRYQPAALRSVTFPWHRLFEIRLDVDVKRHGRTDPEDYVVVEYDPAWAETYERDRVAVVAALGGMVRGIEHVGSTSVPGLAAKPIIDILLGVDADDLDRIIEPLERIGYEYNPDGEISLPHRRYFRRLLPDGTNTHHLHAVEIGGEFWNRHIRFRDYLRANPSKAEEYAALKREHARQHRGGIDYTFAKTEFIRSVEALAGVRRRTRRSARSPGR